MNGSSMGNMSKVKSFVKRILCGVPWLEMGWEFLPDSPAKERNLPPGRGVVRMKIEGLCKSYD
jgi:hypothetical protein